MAISYQIRYNVCEMAQRKKHLKYRARKTDSALADSHAAEAAVTNQETATAPVVQAAAKKTQKSDRKSASEPKVYSALTREATATLQRELRHLLVVAIAIGILYVLLWVVFARFGVEDRIIQALKL